MPVTPIPSSPLPWLAAELRLAGSLDNRIITLLQAIESSGSLNKAAKQVGMSYKGAWQLLERANNLAPKQLLHTTTGGNQGGGSQLTEAGKALLDLFQTLEKEHQQFLQHLNQRLSNDPISRLLLTPLRIKTTASNQLFARVVAITTGTVNADVLIELKGGEQLVANLDMKTLDEMALKTGDSVLALMNAAELTVVSPLDNTQLSARNALSGIIIRIQSGPVTAEIVVALAQGDHVLATLSQSHLQQLSLHTQQSIRVVFKANAVLLARLSDSI